MSKKITAFILFFILFFVLLIFFIQEIKIKRDPTFLLNKYYTLKESHPKVALLSLKILLDQQPNHLKALEELSQYYLNHQQYKKALDVLLKINQLKPNDSHTQLALAYLYLRLGDDKKAKRFAYKAHQGKKVKHQQQALVILSYLQKKKQLAKQSEPLLLPPILNIKLKTEKTIANGDAYIKKLNHYYTLKSHSPEKAQAYLLQLIKTYPDKAILYQEAAFYALKENNKTLALEHLNKAYQLEKSPEIAANMAHIYQSLGETRLAKKYFKVALTSSEQKTKKDARLSLENIIASEKSKKIKLSKFAKRMNAYYQLKKKHPFKAYLLIQKIIKNHPNQLDALKEGGYRAVAVGNIPLAIHYFKRALRLEKSPEISLEIAYLYNKQQKNFKAYQYFYLSHYYATQQLNIINHQNINKENLKSIRLEANRSMTVLAGNQTKVLRRPYFAEIYFNPFYFSRFNLLVNPFLARFGIGDDNNALYLSYRRTRDSRSDSSGQLPQIFEDNVEILALGGKVKLIENFPLYAFAEVGKARDLIDRNRPKTRNDLRAGIYYYEQWGAKPNYYNDSQWFKRFYSSLYFDTIYFSRYDDNIIATASLNAGVRAFEYQSGMINLYLAGHGVMDKQHQFFNNVVEFGPGISLIPTNRLNVAFRFEYLKGYYLPVNNPTPNPYGSQYHNKVYQLNLYLRF